MRFLTLICSLFIFSNSYAYENTVVANNETFDQVVTFGHMKALTFNTETTKKLVIECIDFSGQGIIGLADNYVGYNMLTPAKFMKVGECKEVFKHIENGGTLFFKWTLLGCTYGQCNYDVAYELAE